MGTPNLIGLYAGVLIDAAADKGFDAADICRLAAVPKAAVPPLAETVTPETFGRISRTVKETLDDEFCGFTPSRCRARTLPFVCESIIREDTLGDALNRAFGLYSLISEDLHFSLLCDDDYATILVTLTQPALDRFHYLTEWWLMIWPRLSCWMIGEEIPVTVVEFPHGPRADVDEYTETFWGPCKFFQTFSRMQFPKRFLRRPIIRTMSDVKQFFANLPVDTTSVPGVNRSWKALIKTKMKECLIKTEALLTIEDLAAEFNMSSQTLRRRLEDDGISFRSLKDEVRREVILKWLGEPNIPIGEVSLRAGFAEPNGLVRAVRSWVGVSPREYRGLVMGAIAQSPHNSLQ
jgi:AraC-like DNA-binding protein